MGIKNEARLEGPSSNHYNCCKKGSSIVPPLTSQRAHSADRVSICIVQMQLAFMQTADVISVTAQGCCVQVFLTPRLRLQTTSPLMRWEVHKTQSFQSYPVKWPPNEQTQDIHGEADTNLLRWLVVRFITDRWGRTGQQWEWRNLLPTETNIFDVKAVVAVIVEVLGMNCSIPHNLHKRKPCEQDLMTGGRLMKSKRYARTMEVKKSVPSLGHSQHWPERHQ